MDLSDISIIKLLPPNLARDNNVRMMCVAFDKELHRLIADIPGISIIPNLVRKEITDNLLLDLLAWQFHVDFYDPSMSVEMKRELVLNSLDWHTRKGTPGVVEEIVSTVFSKAEIQEWFEYGGLPYRFRIGTEEEMPDGPIRNNLIRAINSVKNTRSFLEKLTSIIIFEDEIHTTDELEMTVYVNGFEDRYGDRFKFNGAAKFDGVTRNEYVYSGNWVFVHGKFDGKHKFNGDLPFGATGHRKFNGEYSFDGEISFNGAKFGIKPERIKNPYRAKPPFKFSSGIIDTLDFTIGIEHEDIQRATLLFDGSVKFNAAAKFNNISPFPINDPIANAKDIKFNGDIQFDGKYQFNRIFGKKIRIRQDETALSDDMESSDDLLMTIYKHHHFNGAFNFDGSIKFNGIPHATAG